MAKKITGVCETRQVQQSILLGKLQFIGKVASSQRAQVEQGARDRPATRC